MAAISGGFYGKTRVTILKMTMLEEAWMGARLAMGPGKEQGLTWLGRCEWVGQ